MYANIRKKFSTPEYIYQSILDENHCEWYKKLASWSWSVLFTLAFFSFTYTLLFCRKRKTCCDHCFLQEIRPRNTVQLYILRDYLSRRIGFNMNNKRHPLPIVYTILVRIRKFQSLLFYSELNELCGSYIWVLKWVNFHCN